jgi:hypothetical protein
VIRGRFWRSRPGQNLGSMQVRTLGRGYSHRGARRRGADGSATWQLRCPPTRPTGHCFDRQVTDRTRAYGSPKITCAVELGRNPGTRCASHSWRRRRGGGMRVSWPDFYAASTALPAAPSAGFPPLISTFSPTRFHEEPHFLLPALFPLAHARDSHASGTPAEWWVFETLPAEGDHISESGGLKRDFQSPAPRTGVVRHRWFKSRARNHRNRLASPSRRT